MLASTLLISLGPKPVAVRLCFGRLKPGPTGPTNVEMGAPIESFRSRGAPSTAAAAAMLRMGAWEAEGVRKNDLIKKQRTWASCAIYVEILLRIGRELQALKRHCFLQ